MSDEHQKTAKRERLAELLGTDSQNFLGTGLTMREFMTLHSAEQVAASWALQPQPVKRRRRKAVIQLSIESGHVLETSGFAVGVAELAIEAVIEGDWKLVEDYVDYFTFDDEDPATRDKHAPRFAVFRELLLQVLRTRTEAPT